MTTRLCLLFEPMTVRRPITVNGIREYHMKTSGSVTSWSVLVIAQGNLPPVALGLPETKVPEDAGRVTVALRDFFDDDRDTDEMLVFSV